MAREGKQSATGNAVVKEAGQRNRADLFSSLEMDMVFGSSSPPGVEPARPPKRDGGRGRKEK